MTLPKWLDFCLMLLMIPFLLIWAGIEEISAFINKIFSLDGS